MIENLSKEQLEGILEAIPVEISFVDENDLVKFWNKHEPQIFKHSLSVRNKTGKYLGTLEATQDITKIKEIEGGVNESKRNKGWSILGWSS